MHGPPELRAMDGVGGRCTAHRIWGWELGEGLGRERAALRRLTHERLRWTSISS
ncbi:MAG: hypothetical protein QOE40_868, partial [Actinomycetota bacterium]|nr:hypothetical protein [Actinomycetota bacterium]